VWTTNDEFELVNVSPPDAIAIDVDRRDHARARAIRRHSTSQRPVTMSSLNARASMRSTSTRMRSRARARVEATRATFASPSSANASATEDARALVAWASYDRATECAQLKFFDIDVEGERGREEGGRRRRVGVSVNRDVDAGASVLSVPQRACVTIVDVGGCAIVGALAEGRPELIGLALWLCAERLKGEASDWAPYVKTLEANPEAPLFWERAEDFNLLKGSPVRQDAIDRAKSAVEEYESIAAMIKGDPAAYPPEAYEFFTKERFVDALATVCAKATWLPSATCYALVPVLDLIPICGSPIPGVRAPSASDGRVRCVADYDFESECVVLRTSSKAAANSMVLQIDPLQRNNGELFLNLGAVDSTHPGDYLYMSTQIVASDRLFTAKKQVLEGMGMSAEKQLFPVYEDRLPTQLYSYLRFSRVQDPGELMKVSFQEDKIVSVMNEYEILQILMGDCRELMSEYDTNEEDELNLLKNVDKKLRPREIETAKLRMSEKKLIGATMTAVRKRLAPIRGIPTKQGMEDPNQDLLDIFSAIESIPNKPKEMFQDFKKWARGDYEEEFNRPKGGGGGCS